MRLLHAADLHVDSPLRGLSSYEGAPSEAIRSATRHAVTGLVDLAISEAVDAVLLAGDIFDGEWRDYNTGLFFKGEMLRLKDADIKVYLVSGNHDAESQISRRLSMPENVHNCDRHAPETFVDERLGLAVHGQGYAQRDVYDNLAAAYPAPRSGMFNVGLLHTALTNTDHALYAPCGVEELVAKGYDYWALGHVHARQSIDTGDAGVRIEFPGNTQGRHAKETGPKGCLLVTADGSAPPRVEFRELDVVRWARVEADASGASDLDDVLAVVRDALGRAHDEARGRLLAARVEIVGASDAHYELWQSRERLVSEVRGIGAEFDQVWVEKVRPRTRPADTVGADDAVEVMDIVADMRRTAGHLRADGAGLVRRIERSPLFAKLPIEARDQLGSGGAGWREELLDGAVDLLIAMVEERP